MAKKRKKAISSEQPDIFDEITPTVCRLKHESIDKELKNIKKDIKAASDNLIDKIVVDTKSIGEKIDKLNSFDDTLKGNGTPGIQENIRTLKWKFNILSGLLVIMLILFIGGDIKGVTWKKIGAFFGWKIESKQIDGIYINDIDGGILKVDEEGHIIIKKERNKLSAMPKDS